MRKTPDRIVSAAEANRRFSELLRHVRDGRSVLVTSHGRPVARMIPADGGGALAATNLKRLLSRLRREKVVTIGRWTRDELYEGPR